MRATGILAAVAVLALASGAAASAAGYGPFADVAGDLSPVGPGDGGSSGGSGGADSGGTGSDGDANSGGGDAGGEAGDGTTPRPPPFSMAVVSIEECGDTCRDVTLRVTNERNRTATGVAVEATLFAGTSTDESDEVWADQATLGSLEPGASVEITRRVELGLMDAAAIKQADGWVTVRTTITSDEETATFTEEKQVA